MKQQFTLPFSAEVTHEIQTRLLEWFEQEQRDLPWRKSYTPYEVWIAEIMGQQTQMDRVALYFTRWLNQFPDVKAVAEGSMQSLLKAWEGLGYYSRVRNIHRTAKILVNENEGRVPQNYRQLLGLPGIGPYTAAAIMSIAFNEPYPLLDANVERVFSRLADIDRPVRQTATKKMLHQMAEALLSREQPRAFNQALMELGALVCTPKRTDCHSCPLKSHCKALQAGTVNLRPVPAKPKKVIDIVMACGIIQQDGKVYIQQRLEDDIWGGLWEFPGGRLKEGESPENGVVREIEEETAFAVKDVKPFKTVIHYYTKYKVTLHAFFCRLTSSGEKPVLQAASQYRWSDVAELAGYPYPSGHRQLVQALLKKSNSGKMVK